MDKRLYCARASTLRHWLIIIQTRFVRSKTAGHAALYLLTPDQQLFYKNLGWQELLTDSYRGLEVTIMKFDLGSD